MSTVADAHAAGAQWRVLATRGAVLVLSDHQWHEIRPGDAVADGQAVRTLQTGFVELAGPGAHLRMGPDTALTVDHSGRDSAILKQYTGTVSAAPTSAAGVGIDIGSDAMEVRIKQGLITVRVIGEHATVSVQSGSATIVDRSSGHSVPVASGQTVTAGPGLASVLPPAAAPGPPGHVKAAGATQANDKAPAGDNGPAGGGPKGPAGPAGGGPAAGPGAGGPSGGGPAGEGPGGGNGNGNGNGGENGNGNAGSNGNGNGNGGGNGNGNGGGNGNGNGGGNGNGNGHNG